MLTNIGNWLTQFQLNPKFDIQKRGDSGFNGEDRYRMRIHSKNLIKLLVEKYKITPRKSLTLTFPDMPDHLIPHYLRGYNDGDGGIYLYDYHRKIKYKDKIYENNIMKFYICIEGTKEFLTKIAMHFNRLINIRIPKITKHSGGDIYLLRYSSGADYYDICQYLYQAPMKFFLKRKYDVWLEFRNRKEGIRPDNLQDWFAEEVDKLVELHKNGLSYKEISKQLNRSKSSITNKLHTLKKKDNPSVKINEHVQSIKTWGPSEIAELTLLDKQGLTNKEISSKLSRTALAIAAKLHSLRIKNET